MFATCQYPLDFGLHNQIGLTFMLSPLTITGGQIMNSGQKLELVEGHLLGLDAKLMLQLALSSIADTYCLSPCQSSAHHPSGPIFTKLILFNQFRSSVQGVRAASVGPHVGESDLLGGTLLKQELVVGVEQEDTKGTVQEASVDVGHQMAYDCRKR